MADFYKGQKVVILGGEGFVGRHLCRLLKSRGATVYVVDNLSRHKSQLFQYSIGQDVNLDIASNPSLESFLVDLKPFAVFNLAAAVAGVEYNQTHQNQMFLDNVQLQTIPVLACEHANVPHYLQVSSACVYGDDANSPAIENNLGGEPVAANAGYSWAKRMGERAIQWSILKHAVIVRPSNIYGPGDWDGERAHVIPKLIEGYAKGTAKLFGMGAQVREFIYVEDVAEGMLHALEFGGNKEAYNLGSKSRVSIATLHRLIANQIGVPMSSPQDYTFNPGDDKRTSDLGAMAVLGWLPETSLEDGLRKTIDAYLER